MNKDSLGGTDGVEEFWDEKYATFNADEEVVGDLNLVNQDIELKGKKILIVAIGTGKEVVRAARMGADVYGIDISSNAVKNARAMLHANSLDGTVIVGDGAETAFESKFFDMVWGCSVLHHLDHAKFSKELDRILADDGVAIWVEEPTFFNPLFKFAYETLFGEGRIGRRKKVLFFTRRGDEYEKPIEQLDLAYYEDSFLIEKIPCQFMFVEKIAHVVFPGNGRMYELFGKIDTFFLNCFPRLKKYSYEYHFVYHRK